MDPHAILAFALDKALTFVSAVPCETTLHPPTEPNSIVVHRSGWLIAGVHHPTRLLVAQTNDPPSEWMGSFREILPPEYATSIAVSDLALLHDQRTLCVLNTRYILTTFAINATASALELTRDSVFDWSEGMNAPWAMTTVQYACDGPFALWVSDNSGIRCGANTVIPLARELDDDNDVPEIEYKDFPIVLNCGLARWMSVRRQRLFVLLENRPNYNPLHVFDLETNAKAGVIAPVELCGRLDSPIDGFAVVHDFLIAAEGNYLHVHPLDRLFACPSFG